jgi:GxxExxY protein
MDAHSFDELNQLSYKVIGAAMRVHTDFGPGMKEAMYQAALAHSLRKDGHHVDEQVSVSTTVGDLRIPKAFKADLIVDRKLLIEVKSERLIRREHIKQVSVYLRLANLRLGPILNFGAGSLRNGLKRVINNADAKK